MKIEMKTIYAGPKGNYKAGQVVDMDPEEARDLIDGGYAIKYVAAPKPKTAEEKEQAAADKKAEDKKANDLRNKKRQTR